MNRIPIGHIKAAQKYPDFSERFGLQNGRNFPAGNDMFHEFNRHDFLPITANLSYFQPNSITKAMQSNYL